MFKIIHTKTLNYEDTKKKQDKYINAGVELVGKLSQRAWTSTPRGTVNQELKLSTKHLLRWFGW